MWHTIRMRFLLNIMKINAHEMPLSRPILLIALKIGLCVRVCFFLGHPKILQIRVSWFPVGMGGGQIDCHKVSDMTAPRDHANSELITECHLSLPSLYQWQPVGDHRLSGQTWVRLFGY
jgi:hypothetical protein